MCMQWVYVVTNIDVILVCVLTFAVIIDVILVCVVDIDEILVCGDY